MENYEFKQTSRNGTSNRKLLRGTDPGSSFSRHRFCKSRNHNQVVTSSEPEVKHRVRTELKANLLLLSIVTLSSDPEKESNL